MKDNEKSESERWSPRLSIDLAVREEIIPEEKLTAVMAGCIRGIRKLGHLGKTISTVRVTFGRPHGLTEHIPEFTFYFKDPLNKECSHSFNMRSADLGKIFPSAEEIEGELSRPSKEWDSLAGLIIAHLRRCETRMGQASSELAAHLGSNGLNYFETH